VNLPVELIFHLEPVEGEPVWWAESPQIPGLAAAAPTLGELRDAVWAAVFVERLTGDMP
jgi:predicted RNase H-like HicB family nuclease